MKQKTLQDILPLIQKRDANWEKAARNHIAQLTMPYWALGRVLDLAVDVVSIQKTLKPSTSKKSIFVMASDHGIVDQGVSAYPKAVTAQMIGNFLVGGAAINVLGKLSGAEVYVVDMGVDADLTSLSAKKNFIQKKISHGTKDFSKVMAMSREEAMASIEVGINLALEHAPHTDIFATGDMGIGNTTASAAIAACITKHPVEVLVGRGTGINDQRLAHKTNVIINALALHSPDSKDPLDILAKVGGFEIGALTGLILGASAMGKMIMVDGYISTAAALLAKEFSPDCINYMELSHSSAERGHELMCEHLGLKPLLNLNMRLGEGTGAALAFNLVEAASRIMKEMATFSEAAISEKS